MEGLLLGDISVGGILINALLVLVLAQALAWHYIRFARVLSNKPKFARVLVFIALTTLLMISVVKTSLALSLGLVGALSIIRFRTPVKESEELAYLFLSIAIGTGIGANQRMVTVTIVAVILICMALLGTAPRGRSRAQSLLHVSLPLPPDHPDDPSGEAQLAGLRNAVEAAATAVNLRRVDRHAEELEASFLVELPGAEAVGTLLRRIQDQIPGAAVSVVDKDCIE